MQAGGKVLGLLERCKCAPTSGASIADRPSSGSCFGIRSMQYCGAALQLPEAGKVLARPLALHLAGMP